MKKIVLTGLFIAASLSFAATATDIERQAAAIDQQIQVIENRTSQTLAAEQQKAEVATDNVAKYSELLENVQDQLDVVAGERKVSFYEKEYQGVISSLTSFFDFFPFLPLTGTGAFSGSGALAVTIT